MVAKQYCQYKRAANMNTAEAIEFYRSAKDTVKNSQFCNELDWQISRNINSFTESELLRETA